MTELLEASRDGLRIDDGQLDAAIDALLGRRPCVGLAIGVVRGGGLAFFRGHGLADIPSGTPITMDTAFRIGSVTKLFTGIAAMQLSERGEVDLDAAANDYLRGFRLVAADRRWRPATVRHLLTHTAGIPDVWRVTDLRHTSWVPTGGRPPVQSVSIGDALPSLADCYRGGLRIVAEPGTAFAYSGHGFATLGQIVEDVSGEALDRYLRDAVFLPLGMADTDLLRTARVKAQLATGYEMGRHGPRAVTDREWVGRGAGAIYSTSRDMARFVAALLDGGTGEGGRALRPATLAAMLDPGYRPDPRLPGMGFAFFRSDAGGHRVVGHDGIMPGFNANVLVAPDDGIGVFGLTNGSPGAFAWLQTELAALLRRLIGVPPDAVRQDVPHRPEIWRKLCGLYRLPPRVSDLRGRLAMGGGIQVFVGGGRLMARMLTPIPALYRGFELHPDDEADPYVFRLDFSRLGLPTVRAAFSHEPGLGATAIHTDLQSLSFERRRTRT